MPRELPGMRWDDDKHRYFPLASPQIPTRSHLSAAVAVKRPRLSTSYHALSDLRSVCRTVHKDALIHQIQSSQFSLTDKVVRSTIPLQGVVSAFQTVSYSGRVWSFVGDTFGWFYSSVVDMHHEETDTMDGWQRQFHLSSEAR
jgi:WD repeat-containing protein 21A